MTIVLVVITIVLGSHDYSPRVVMTIVLGSFDYSLLVTTIVLGQS